ncbi:hypothetical protein AMECASPLE_007508 [Ameca splendens]|uniref:Uncharacterized protein n=1 Tax=Ameca splendens TaxID=208324 RepID=A0ABV0XZY0_9TELE
MCSKCTQCSFSISYCISALWHGANQPVAHQIFFLVLVFNFLCYLLSAEVLNKRRFQLGHYKQNDPVVAMSWIRLCVVALGALTPAMVSSLHRLFYHTFSPSTKPFINIPFLAMTF